MKKSNPVLNRFPDRKRWGYVLIGIIVMMCLGTVYSYSVFRVPVEKAYNAGATMSGMPYMTALASYALFMYLAGKYLDKYNPRHIIALGGLLVSLGWVLSAYTTSIYMLTVTYGLISGAGVGIVYGVPLAVAARWFPDKKGLAVGMILIGFGISPLITAPLARTLVEQYGVMNAFRTLGIGFGVIIPLLSFMFRYPSDGELAKLSKAKYTKTNINELDTSSMKKSGNFRGLYLNFLIGTTVGLMLIGLTGSVGTELIGLTSREVSLLMALFAVFNGMGRPVFGWVTDKLTSKKSMLISYGLILSSAVLMLFAHEGDVLIYSISFSVFWFNLGGWLAIAPASTLALFGTKHYSQNNGLVFTAYGIGAIAGVATSGMLIDLHQNYHYVFYFVILLCLAGVLMALKLLKGSEHVKSI